MSCPNCPVCNTKLEFIDLDLHELSTTRHFNCPKCKIEYHEYCPQGAESTWYAHIALSRFPKGTWEMVLFTEWNYCGDPMPERLSCNGPSEQEKEEATE